MVVPVSLRVSTVLPVPLPQEVSGIATQVIVLVVAISSENGVVFVHLNVQLDVVSSVVYIYIIHIDGLTRILQVYIVNIQTSKLNSVNNINSIQSRCKKNVL